MPTLHSIDALLKASSLPALEARILMMHALHKTRVQLITQSEYELTEAELTAYQQLEQRRIDGVPIAYLTGQREFFGLDFHVTPDVLIPRPDTELLVELALQFTPSGSSLLDLGTGSGAIAVALAHQRPDLSICASDISAAALAVARHNAQSHHCRIQFIESDWYSALPQMQWHTIVSNPPYIENHDPHLSQGDLRFEPLHALTDHADGLMAYRHIIGGATSRLANHGWLLFEHGYNQAAALRAMLAAHNFAQIQSWRDIAGIERVTGGQFGI
ncbi:release factor glutamine methyltransferase [Oxalobacteraceae bacterium GrIS 2.11]